MKAAYVVDIGSVSVRLLVGCISRMNTIRILHESSRLTHLIQGLGSDGCLNEESRRRTIGAISDLLKQQTLPEEGRCLATHVLRVARNAGVFEEEFRRITGCRVDILSPEDEGRLAWAGSQDLLTDKDMLVDIGGGSMEIMHLLEDGRLSLLSYPVGAGSILGTRNFSGCFTSRQLTEMQQEVNGMLRSMIAPTLGCCIKDLVILGGTAVTAGMIVQSIATYHRGCIHGRIIPTNTLENLILKTSRADSSDRAGWIGMEHGRKDIFLPGLLLVSSLCELIRKDQFRISEHGIRYGMLRRLLENQ